MSEGPPDGNSAHDVRLVPAALTAWLATAAGIVTPVGVVLPLGFVTGAAVIVLARRRLSAGLSAGVLVVCLVGAGFGLSIALRTNDIQSHPLVDRIGATVVVTVTPAESPRSLNGGGRLLIPADLELVEGRRTGGRVTVFAPAARFADAAVGRPMRFRARVARPLRRDLTVATLTASGDPVFGEPSALQRWAESVREGFAAAARDSLPADRAPMLPALVLGDTSAVTGAVTEQFRAAGLTHLTAVSGANVTIVCGTMLLVASLLGPRAAVVLAGLALVAFVLVVQPSASVLRAAVMGAITLLALTTSRRRQAIPALAGTVLIVLTVAPQFAVDVGFALSVCATAALVVVGPVWSRRLVERGWPKPMADAVSIAVAAQLVTAPLIAAVSGRLSLVAVAANIAAAPMIAPITVLGTAAATLSAYWPGAAHLLIRFTGPELWWLLSVARWASAFPGATVPVPDGGAGVLVVGAIGVAAVLVWRTRWRRAGIAVVVICALAWSIAEVSVGRGTIVG